MKSITMLILLTVLCSSMTVLYGADPRAELSQSPLDVAKQMIAVAETGAFESLTAPVASLAPVLASIKTGFKVDLAVECAAAIKAMDADAIRACGYKLAFYDMRDLMAAIVTKGGTVVAVKLKGWHKIAYLDYLFLSKQVIRSRSYYAESGRKEAGTFIDGRIKRMFRSAYLALGKKSAYSKSKSRVNLGKYKKMGDAIAVECRKVLTEVMSVSDKGL